MGSFKRKSAFEYAQIAQIKSIMRLHKLLIQTLALHSYILCSIQRPC